MTIEELADLEEHIRQEIKHQLAESHDETVKSAVNLVLQHLKSLGVTID